MKGKKAKSPRQLKITLGQKITVSVMVMQIIVILLLSAFVTSSATAGTKETAINNMEAITQERAQIVRNYVKETENTLTAYSRAGEITALLKKGRERKEKKAFVIEGRKMFEEICSDESRLIQAYFSESYVKEKYPDGNLPKIPYEIVADKVYQDIKDYL